MSENGVMDRPRRTTRSSFASSTGGGGGGGGTPGPGTPPSSSNPYKKPTYSGRGGDTPASSKNTNGPSSGGRGRRGRGRPPGRSSFSYRGGGHSSHQHTKPECIAVRVDGRRSTGGSTASSGGGKRGAATSGGRRSTYTSRHEYDYHYGSDFESDQNDSELEEEDAESDANESDDGDSESIAEGNGNENAESHSDSDYSVGSSRVTSSSRLPSPPVPIWLDSDKVPEVPTLNLPNSSDDLLLPREHVVKAVEIYEPLRRFQQLVRLSPFRFEDFCGALAIDDQSSLLVEIHIQLLKAIIREEDANSTLFGPNEVKDSVQAVYFFVDHITWPETLRSYLESDPAWADVYEALASVEYPFCGPAVRIKVLGWLVDQFLTTNVVREQLLGDGSILHEDHCRACNRLGELICCEQCPAVYHIECVTPALKDPTDPPDDWKCPVCVKHQVPGVNDCASEVERLGILIRHERLGYDRHGRKYWFLVRRILVESENGSEVWYYSTRCQVEDLLSQLDADLYECDIVSNMKSVEDELYRQMEVTEEVTRLQNTQRRKTYLEVANGKEDGGAEGQERMTRLKSTGLYKLGQEGLFRTYTNLYISDACAMSKGKQNEERDRKRYMSHKFSLTTASECKYGIKDLTGCPRATQLSALRNALTHMEAALPTTLMHVNWPTLRKTWVTTVQTATNAENFSQAMIMISACIRNAVYNPVWSESAGHVRLHRMSIVEKDERKKAEKRDKKDKDDEEDRIKAYPQFVKYTIPIRHQVYKQKGEEYRLHGRWGWIWLSNMRRCKPVDCRQQGLLAGPHKHVIQVKNETGKVKTMLIDPGVYSKLMAKRNLTVTNNTSNAKPAESASVTNGPSETAEATSSKEAGEPSDSPSVIADDVEEMKETLGQIEESQTNENGEKSNKSCESEEKELKQENNVDTCPHSMDSGVDTQDKASQPEGSTGIEGATPVPVTEPKSEPMEVDDAEVSQNECQEPREQTDVKENGDDKKLTDESLNADATQSNETQEMEIADAESETKQPTNESNLETDNKPEAEEAAKLPIEVTDSTSSENNENESKGMPITEPEKEIQVKDLKDKDIDTATTTDIEANQLAATESQSPPPAESDNGNSGNGPSAAAVVESTQVEQQQAPPAAPAPEKPLLVDSQRKFKTELINVSTGLSNAHRVFYPKVARRSEYLDNLLHRRLALMSLEEKNLKSTYGEDMVAKAKSGIIQFEEEEKKRAQEAEEYPGEEVIDEHLTLAGAYSFQCYSSECLKESKLFVKTKGKNRERLYEKVCYSPMCRLKFCLQETTRLKMERMREVEKERYFKIYKEIEEKRSYTVEGTSHKLYMQRLPEASTSSAGVTPSMGVAINKGSITVKKKPTTVVYPQTSSFQCALSKKPSILVPPQFELKRLARTAGRMFTPGGFFQNQKSGSWGWSLPCGRPVFRTAWQYKTTHAMSLGTAAMQLRVLYASIRWDDILAKIPNTEGKHQVHTDTEIITSEILHHRLIGRFTERVQYLRRAMVVPIDAPKTIREVTPSRIGLRKRKRAESPDKMEPVITEDWVDEEKLELWEIRYYGDRMDRKQDRRSENSTPSASTRTKSGIAIKQPEKYDPSHNPIQHSGERKTYAAAHSQQQQQISHSASQPHAETPTSAVAVASSASDNLARTIEHVVRNHEAKQESSGRTVSAVKTAELMRETIETELKMQRAVHLSKRDSHTKNGVSGGSKPALPTTQPTASQQFQQQQNSANKAAVTPASGSGTQSKNIAPSTPTSSKVGQVVVGKKFFASRQNSNSGLGAVTAGGLDTGILTKRPHQGTITINKGAGGTISIVKNSPASTPATTNVPTTTAAAIAATPGSPNVTVAQPQTLNPVVISSQGHQQKLNVVRLPDGRLHVRGLLPGQHCYQTADGKIHVTLPPGQAAAQLEQLKQQPAATPKPLDQEVTPATTSATVPTSTSTIATSSVQQTVIQEVVRTQTQNLATSASPMSTIAATAPAGVIATNVTAKPAQISTGQALMVSTAPGIQQQGTALIAQHVLPNHQPSQQPVINISNQAVKSNISSSTTLVQSQNSFAKSVIQQQPAHQQQIIVQQQNGQHLILQGAAAQALIQQQQKLLQQRTVLQTSGLSTGQGVQKIISTSAGVKGQGIAANGSAGQSNQVSVPGRLFLQDGKALLISSSPTTAQSVLPQRNIIVNRQVMATSQAQQTIVRPQVVQTNAQGQLIQGHLIQSGQQLHLITQQHPSPSVSQSNVQQGGQIVVQKTPDSPVKTGAPAITTLASSTGAAAGTGLTPTNPTSTASVPQSPSKTLTTPAISSPAPVAVKHVLPDGRTILLSQSQLSELTGANRKVIVNKQVVQLPSGSMGIRPQQLLQGIGNASTIQILQGPGGQQFLIQQTTTPAANIQHGQQQMQIVVPSTQLGQGQPLLVKKLVKPATVPSSTAGSPASGSVVQVAPTVQNQLTQFLGPNKALVRLDNNQLAAIQLPAQQVGTAAAIVSSSAPASIVSSPVVAQQVQQNMSTTPTSALTPTPAVTSPAKQPQPTTITRTPGLPISIVSPSKGKVQTPPKPGTVQVISTAPRTTVSSSGPTTPTSTSLSSSPPSTVVQLLPGKTPPVLRVSSSPIKSPAPGVLRTTSPVVTPVPASPASTPSMSPQKTSTVVTSHGKAPVIMSPPIFATKSAPPPIPITPQEQSPGRVQPTGPVMVVSSPVPTTGTGTVTVTTAALTPATQSQPDSTSIPVSSVNPLPHTPQSQPKLVTPTKSSTAVVPGQPTSLPQAIPTSAGPPASEGARFEMPRAATTSNVVATPKASAAPITTTASASSTTKPKTGPSKIVAQIFQTPQGPKVVIQGVSPNELSPAQMAQLQAQIQKQLAAQQQAAHKVQVNAATRSSSSTTPTPPATAIPVTTNEPVVSSLTAQSGPVVASIPSQFQGKPESRQSPLLTASSLAAQQSNSPIEVLRSVTSPPLPSPLSSPILARSRSPFPTTMVSPAKILSPPPNVLMPPKPVVASVPGVSEPTGPATLQQQKIPTPAAPVVARKSAPRKSPIRPNNLDSPPPIMSSIPSPPPQVISTVQHGSTVGNTNCNSVAMSLMQPLSSEQQLILTERRNSLKEDIMDKKKAAVTKMKLEAQREIQAQLEKATALELADNKSEDLKRPANAQHLAVDLNRGNVGKKRKLENDVGNRSRTTPMEMGGSAMRGSRGRGRGGGRGGGRKRKLLCVCKTPYDKDRFYVGCDKCENWFHGDCVGITEEISKDLPEYICDDCRDDKLYCLCRKPYNESQFYIQCDKCEDWFHGGCVGVLQGESDTIGDYSCPTCDPDSPINFPNSKKLDSMDYVSINRVLKELLQNRASIPFRKPVTKSQAPNYFSIIKEPMDLQTVSNRVEERQYQRLKEFVGDIGKIFENCRYYNDSTTDIFRLADVLEKVFIQKIWAVRQSFNTRVR